MQWFARLWGKVHQDMFLHHLHKITQLYMGGGGFTTQWTLTIFLLVLNIMTIAMRFENVPLISKAHQIFILHHSDFLYTHGINRNNWFVCFRTRQNYPIHIEQYFWYDCLQTFQSYGVCYYNIARKTPQGDTCLLSLNVYILACRYKLQELYICLAILAKIILLSRLLIADSSDRILWHHNND